MVVIRGRYSIEVVIGDCLAGLPADRTCLLCCCIFAASGEKGVISNGSLCFCFYVWLGDYEVDEESRNRRSRFVLSLSGKSKLLRTRNLRFCDPYAPSSSFSLFIWIRRCIFRFRFPSARSQVVGDNDWSAGDATPSGSSS
ncbi:hypothetical protein HPP92_027145 [Vanilla planifolia]|uniref:Uncharacterized protein n=1 Tax=Vanilla planifolia TaxID=51239 RepID=A0A835PC02_VANPL|nr:hypothetical protein HPP92_027145 [Vanilla planifolia]